MKPLSLILAALLLASCAHQRKVTLDPPATSEWVTEISAAIREKIAFYENADAAGFVAQCAREKQWLLLSFKQPGTDDRLPGTTQAELGKHLNDGSISFISYQLQIIDFPEVKESEWQGELLELRSKLLEAKRAYATRVNRAVIAELERFEAR